MPLFAPLTNFLFRLIPERSRDKLLAHSVGRKVPLIGTLSVGIADIVEICREPNEVNSWLSLGSTIAAEFPPFGTALSVAIDIGVLMSKVAESLVTLKDEKNALITLQDLGFTGFTQPSSGGGR